MIKNRSLQDQKEAKGIWGKIKDRHPYNFTSKERKLGFIGVGLAILLSLWNTAGWRVAMGVTVFMEALIIVVWDMIESFVKSKMNIRKTKKPAPS